MTNSIGARDDALSERLQSSFARHADLPALEGREAVLSYRQLDRHAEGLAQALLDAGVRAGDIVPLWMRRSPELVVAQLAVLRIGAAYAPIDLASPASRQQAMLTALRPSLVVTDGTQPLPQEAHALRTLDASACAPSDGAASPLPWTTPSPGVPAYVMFTSGTTGTPKGVMVPRSGIVRLVCEADFAEFRPGARWGFLSSPAFDASTLEVWAPLLNGGCCVVQEEPWPTLDELADFLIGERITDTWLTAALFSALVDDRPDACAHLRQLLTGGERVSARHARAVLDACPEIRLINGYGPTENTTFTLCHAICGADTENEGGIPIGKPIRGTVVRVAGEGDDPVIGELLAGGEGVALGYLNDPDLTARKFVEIDGERWYRTGDMVRRRDDGVFEFMGRVDRQVKIQGHRIELEEVEATLLTCPGIGAAAVLVRGESAETRHLVACFTGMEGMPPAGDTVAAFLEQRLAPPAVPKVLRPMARLPMNINGKIDRAALAHEIEPSTAHVAAPAEAWQSETERALAAIWAKCLHLPAVRRDASFWSVGGTSLLALQVSAQVRRQLGRELSPIDVLRWPMLIDQARHVETAAAVAMTELSMASCENAVPLTQGQQAMLEASQLDATGCAYLVHVAVHVGAGAGLGALRKAFDALADRHPSLRMGVHGSGSTQHATLRSHMPEGWWTEHGPIDTVPRDLAWPADVLARINRPLDLAREGVMRVDAWPVAGGSTLLVWTVHHVAIDEASVDRCLEQLDAVLSGRPLPPVYGSPLGFATIEKAWTDTGAAHAWVSPLIDAWRGKPWTVDRAPGPGREVAIDIPAELGDELLSACNRWGVTPCAPLLAAYGQALQEVFGAAARFVVTPFSRRVEPELVEPVGYLLDMALVDAGAGPDETPADALSRVHAQVLHGQRPSFLPQRVLAEALALRDPQLTRRLNAFCFTWRIAPSRRVPVGRAQAELLRVPQRGARYGVALHASLVDGRLQLSLEALDSVFDDGRAATLVRAFIARVRGLCTVDWVAAAAQPPSPSSLPATVRPASAAVLRDAWSHWLGVPPEQIEPSSNFLRSGGNSLTAMRMLSQLRRDHGMRVDASAFLSAPTFECLGALTSQAPAQAPDCCVLIGSPSAAKVLVLVPGKGGQALGLFKLGELVQARLGQDHAVAIMDLDAMLSRVPHEHPRWFLEHRMAQWVKELGPQRIVALAGFSLGGLLALRLAAHFPGEKPPPVWLLDSYAPRMMVRTLGRRIERRLAWLLAGRQRPGMSAATVRKSGEPPTSGAAPSTDALWDRIQQHLAEETFDGPSLEVHLVQAGQSIDEVGVLWRRNSNGFNPRRYARWHLHRLDAMHLDLPRALAADTAALFVTGLRWSGMPIAA